MRLRLMAVFLGLLLLALALATGPGFQPASRVLPRTGRPAVAALGEHLLLDPETHPNGHQVQGLLPWDRDADLEKMRLESGATYLMAAYQTTEIEPMFDELHNLAVAARFLSGAVVQPGEMFSLDRCLGPRTRERGFREGPAYVGTTIIKVVGGGICQIATTLYNVAVLADLPIVERHPHGMLVAYVPPGQDATIARGVKDVKFLNSTSQPLIIWSEAIDATLYIAIYGSAAPPQVSWRHEVLRHIPAQEVRRVNRTLPQGTTRVILEGYDGMTVKSWISVTAPDGSVKTRFVGTDSYAPLSRVVEVNP